MNRFRHILLLILCTLVWSINIFAQADTTKASLKLSDVNFTALPFGYQSGNESTVYSLLGNDSFKADINSEMGEFIFNWIAKNKDAEVIRVSKESISQEQGVIKYLIYCWLVNKTDTLNIELIRQGAFPGSTMIRPRENKKDKNSKVELLISESDYSEFLIKIKKAELEAFEKRLGIWKSFTVDPRIAKD